MTATGALSVPVPAAAHGSDTTVLGVSGRVLGLFPDLADRAGHGRRTARDWGPSGRRDGQYAVDLVTDEAALALLHGAGFAVLSEESGRTEPPGGGAAGVVVIDPLDGSTNASRGV